MHEPIGPETATIRAELVPTLGKPQVCQEASEDMPDSAKDLPNSRSRMGHHSNIDVSTTKGLYQWQMEAVNDTETDTPKAAAPVCFMSYASRRLTSCCLVFLVSHFRLINTLLVQ